MATIAATAIGISCDGYCGLKITKTLAEGGREQHAADCGATEAELADLDRRLQIARIHAGEKSDDGEADESVVTVDGRPAHIVYDQTELPIPPAQMTLTQALEQLDAARERHAKALLALKDAKEAEKAAQGSVNTCVEQLCSVARREAEPELPLGAVE